jgi:hypothetical protein
MTRLYWHLLIGAVIAFGGLAAVLLMARFGMYGEVTTLVFLSGAVGGVVNNYFRLAKLTEIESGDRKEVTPLMITQLYVSVVIAGILAFVAYGLFLSGLIQGSLFPEFENTAAPYAGLGEMILGLAPKTNLDAAKAILWGFIAGFSERFVPNIIDSVIVRMAK